METKINNFLIRILPSVTLQRMIEEWLGSIQDEDKKFRYYCYIQGMYTKKIIPAFYDAEKYEYTLGIAISSHLFDTIIHLINQDEKWSALEKAERKECIYSFISFIETIDPLWKDAYKKERSDVKSFILEATKDPEKKAEYLKLIE